MHFPMIEHHGAKGGVTGACHELHMNAGSPLLMGCGLLLGGDASERANDGRARALEPTNWLKLHITLNSPLASSLTNAGRIFTYFKVMLGDKRHNVLFAGYRATGPRPTQSRCTVRQVATVDLHGECFAVSSGITSIIGYSAHADHKELAKICDPNAVVADGDTDSAYLENNLRRR
ncbi:hypothetical protein N8H22_17400 [Stutzerimonas stutzeri]|uniref:hypothetical protein n=1 Tax=Stutzerimonas sp. S1 TaxID=3030652 RepID=UPI0022247229|nr:hypothetical protein [Stutzerimonas sp. S1]MCW3150383.1 hypothetical protein [Stutzerimonas sp. S1]